MNKLKSLLVFFGLVVAFGASAQSQSDMRLNEILVVNTDDFQDDFGQQNGWCELFNTSYGTVEIGGCYLSNDRTNLTKYIIPKGDVNTKIKPRQHTLFWADSQPYRGTFHVNFKLNESDTLFFVSSDGKTIIDYIAIPKQFATDSSLANVSYGRTEDGIGSNDGSGEGWGQMERTSPSTNNSGVNNESKSMRMAKIDPHGLTLTITSMGTVFLALIILYFIFKYIGKFSVRQRQSKSDSSQTATSKPSISVEDTTSEQIAAIAMALNLYRIENEAHDAESFMITMQHTDRTYSPWSSKIYTLRQTPQVKKSK